MSARRYEVYKKDHIPAKGSHETNEKKRIFAISRDVKPEFTNL